jgi:transcriptional regulator GlxA family with amidase domain
VLLAIRPEDAINMHVVIYLPSAFYSAIASTVVETLQAVNEVRGSKLFSFEFVAKRARAISKSGISFPARTWPSKRIDILILLAGLRPMIIQTVRMLERESEYTTPLIRLAQEQQAVIATTCGAAYLLAASGLLDGKRATISWWLKKEAARKFPKVRWEPSRLIVRQGRIYTCGAAFCGLELITTLLIDLGLKSEERQVRKLMVLPPSRQLQSPYEFSLPEISDPFERKLGELARHNLQRLDLGFLARQLAMSERTLARRFLAELQTTPGKWIQAKRLESARTLLETTKLSISEICYRVGYEDLASFSRLFAKTTGMPPGEFRRELAGATL